MPALDDSFVSSARFREPSFQERLQEAARQAAREGRGVEVPRVDSAPVLGAGERLYDGADHAGWEDETGPRPGAEMRAHQHRRGRRWRSRLRRWIRKIRRRQRRPDRW